jgi:hypothetical protein
MRMVNRYTVLAVNVAIRNVECLLILIRDGISSSTSP